MKLQFNSCIFVEILTYNAAFHFLHLSLRDRQFMKRDFSDIVFCVHQQLHLRPKSVDDSRHGAQPIKRQIGRCYERSYDFDTSA